MLNSATIPRLIASPSARPAFLMVLAVLLAAAFIASIGVGAYTIPMRDIVTVLMSQIGLAEISSPDVARQELVILSLRLPRSVMALMVGAALGISGAVLQGISRNPLADPTLVGVSSGAALAAAITIVLGGSSFAWLVNALGLFALPAFAFLGGLATTILLYKLATRDGRTSVTTMLLAEIAIGALANAGTGILIFYSNDQELRDLTFWMMGSVGGATWPTTWPLLLMVLIFLVLILAANVLNKMLLGSREARLLGVDVDRMVKLLIVGVALIVGAAVSVSGMIGFVGIIVPHIIRLLAGPDHRFVLPGSLLLGGLLLLVADMLARTLVAPADLPIGIVTAIMGAPFFIWLLLGMRRRLGD